MRIARLEKTNLAAVAVVESSSLDFVAPKNKVLLPTVDPLNTPCKEWTSLSVICFGVCELSIRQIRAAAS